MFDGTAVAKKINDLVATEDSGTAEGSILARIEAYKNSLGDIFAYPLIGGLWRSNGGGHSAFLDIMAKYGVFGATMYSVMFYAVPRYYKKKYRNRFVTAMANSSLVSLLFVSLLDSVSYGFVCMVLIVLPMLFEDVIKWTGVEK